NWSSLVGLAVVSAFISRLSLVDGGRHGVEFLQSENDAALDDRRDGRGIGKGGLRPLQERARLGRQADRQRVRLPRHQNIASALTSDAVATSDFSLMPTTSTTASPRRVSTTTFMPTWTGKGAM